ncbi:MAG: endonuclease/exonuclease/phosphatase family protein [Phycisphaerales bacterium]|nr:endonuclease/exonuclease/phosphatase family protein [Phycisphaerales bacterium]
MTANLLVGHGQVDEVVRLIRAQSPDIIFLQEYTPLKADRLVAAIGDQYPHRIEGMRDHAFGCAIYSRIPFKGEPNLYPHAALRSNPSARHFGEVGIWDPQPRAVIEHAGREIVLQNLHFAPPIRISYLREQRLMTKWLCEWLGNEQRPVILAGDLNSTLASANLDDLRRCGVRSARSEAGRGSLGSWPSSGLPSLLPVGIDHILYRGFRCEEFKVGPPIASDHLPLLAVLGD